MLTGAARRFRHASLHRQLASLRQTGDQLRRNGGDERNGFQQFRHGGISRQQQNTAAIGMEDQVADACKAGELQSGARDGKSFIVRIMVQIEFHAVFLLGGYFGIWTSFSSHSPNGSSKRFIWLVM